MKRFCVFAFILLQSKLFFAQDYSKNEIKFNILNAITNASIELGYERFLESNQSIDIELFFNDRFSYFPAKNDRKFSATSIKIGYNYYFDTEGISGVYFTPFLKQRFGSYKDISNKLQNISLSSFIIGVGVGYIWTYNDVLSIAFYGNIGRNFNSEISKEFWSIEPNAGLRIGYRF